MFSEILGGRRLRSLARLTVKPAVPPRANPMQSRIAEAQSVEEVFRKERVGALCRARPATALAETPLAALLELLRGDSGGCVVIVRNRAPIGIFTERDYLDKIAGNAYPTGTTAGAVMTTSPRMLSFDQSLDEAIQLMTDGGYRHLPLVDVQGQLMGVLSVRDIISYLAAFFPVEVMNLPPSLGGDATRREGE